MLRMKKIKILALSLLFTLSLVACSKKGQVINSTEISTNEILDLSEDSNASSDKSNIKGIDDVESVAVIEESNISETELETLVAETEDSIRSIVDKIPIKQEGIAVGEMSEFKLSGVSIKLPPDVSESHYIGLEDEFVSDSLGIYFGHDVQQLEKVENEYILNNISDFTSLSVKELNDSLVSTTFGNKDYWLWTEEEDTETVCMAFTVNGNDLHCYYLGMTDTKDNVVEFLDTILKSAEYDNISTVYWKNECSKIDYSEIEYHNIKLVEGNTWTKKSDNGGTLVYSTDEISGIAYTITKIEESYTYEDYFKAYSESVINTFGSPTQTNDVIIGETSWKEYVFDNIQYNNMEMYVGGYFANISDNLVYVEFSSKSPLYKNMILDVLSSVSD